MGDKPYLGPELAWPSATLSRYGPALFVLKSDSQDIGERLILRLHAISKRFSLSKQSGPVQRNVEDMP